MNKAKDKVIKEAILFNKLVDLKITAPDVVLEICEARNKELDIAIKETIDDRHRIHNISLECARQGAKKEVFEQILGFLKENKLIDIESCTCPKCTKFALFRAKLLNTQDTDEVKK